jgi:Mg-chelatase subunit ChlD
MDFQAYTLQKHNEWACLQLKAPDSSERTPIHLCCVIDTSASMSTGCKLENVKRSLQFLLDFLTPQDMISVITFSQSARTILSPTPVTHLEKDNIRARISLINVESNTNISGGIIQARSALMADTSNMKQSILLLTDGVANVGLTKPADILELVRNTINGFSGTSMSCIGYGTDHNVDLLQNMATEGSGSYYVVNNLEDVAVVFGDVLGGLISCFAQQVHIVLPPGTEVKARYSMMSLADKLEVIIGDLSAGMEAAFLAKIPTGGIVTVTGYNLQTHTPFEMNTVVQSLDDEEHQVNGEAHYLRFEVLNLIETTNIILKRYNVTQDEIKAQLEKVKECITVVSEHQNNHTHSLWEILIQELNTCKNGLENHNNRHHYDMGALMTQRAGYLGRMRGIASQEPDLPSGVPAATPVTRTFSNYVQRQISAQMSATVATPSTPMDPRNASCESSPSMVPLPYDMLPIPPIALTRQDACGGSIDYSNL